MNWEEDDADRAMRWLEQGPRTVASLIAEFEAIRAEAPRIVPQPNGDIEVWNDDHPHVYTPTFLFKIACSERDEARRDAEACGRLAIDAGNAARADERERIAFNLETGAAVALGLDETAAAFLRAAAEHVRNDS
jgi:hypothetical protein